MTECGVYGDVRSMSSYATNIEWYPFIGHGCRKIKTVQKQDVLIVKHLSDFSH